MDYSYLDYYLQTINEDHVSDTLQKNVLYLTFADVENFFFKLLKSFFLIGIIHFLKRILKDKTPLRMSLIYLEW